MFLLLWPTEECPFLLTSFADGSHGMSRGEAHREVALVVSACITWLMEELLTGTF